MSNRKKGFTLIEIVLAIALLVIAMGGIAAVIIGTKNSSEKLFTEGDLQQQLVEVQDSMQDEMLATNVGLKYWVKSGDEWVYPNAETEQEGTPKLFAIYNVDYIDYVLKKQYMYYEPTSKKLYYGDSSESLDMSKKEAYALDVDPDPQAVIDSLNDKWTVSSLKVKTFEIDTFVFSKKRLLPYRITIEQDDVEYKASDTVNIRNQIKVNEPMVIDPAQTAKITKPILENTVFTYNGQQQGPQEKYFNSRYVRRIAGSTLKAKDAGLYYVTYQLTQPNARWADGSKDEITYTWEIKPIELTVTWGTISWTYDGQAHNTTCTYDHSVLIPGDNLTIVLSGNSVGPNVGKQNVEATPSSKNYKIKKDEDTHRIIEITQATAEWASEIQPINCVYDGADHVLTTVSHTQGGTAMFRLVKYIDNDSHEIISDQDWSTVPYTGSKAGQYVIECKIDITDPTNYVAPETKIVTSVISKADPVLTNPVAQTGLVYSGSSLSLLKTLPTAPPGLVVRYSINGAGYSTNQPSGINAGTYTIKYKTNGNNNYNESAEKSITVTIGKANSTYTKEPVARSLVYNGQEQELVIGGTTSHGQIVYYMDGVSYGTTIPKKTNAGTYICQYQIKGNSNHNDTAKKDLTITIEKAAGLKPKPLPSAKDLTFNGNAQELINPGTPQEGTLMYSLDGSTWNKNVPKGRDARNYVVYYKVLGDNNHKDTAADTIIATIKARDIVVFTPPTDYKTYNGKNQQAAPVSTLPVDCTIRYGTTNGVYNLTSPPSRKNAGTLTVYYSVSKTGHKSKTGSYQLVIKKANPTFTKLPAAITGLYYTSYEQNLITPGTTNCGTIVYSIYKNSDNYTTSVPKGRDAITYHVYYKVIGNSNYNETIYSVDATIGNSVLVGDVDLDGDITSIDATTVQQYLAEIITLNKKQLKAADVNNDGRVSGDDVTQIQRYCSGRHDAYNERIGSWIAY